MLQSALSCQFFLLLQSQSFLFVKYRPAVKCSGEIQGCNIFVNCTIIIVKAGLISSLDLSWNYGNSRQACCDLNKQVLGPLVMFNPILLGQKFWHRPPMCTSLCLGMFGNFTFLHTACSNIYYALCFQFTWYIQCVKCLLN